MNKRSLLALQSLRQVGRTVDEHLDRMLTRKRDLVLDRDRLQERLAQGAEKQRWELKINFKY
jgi:hypothetical protein